MLLQTYLDRLGKAAETTQSRLGELEDELAGLRLELEFAGQRLRFASRAGAPAPTGDRAAVYQLHDHRSRVRG
jgi:hypothetical protein